MVCVRVSVGKATRRTTKKKERKSGEKNNNIKTAKTNFGLYREKRNVCPCPAFHIITICVLFRQCRTHTYTVGTRTDISIGSLWTSFLLNFIFSYTNECSIMYHIVQVHALMIKFLYLLLLCTCLPLFMHTSICKIFTVSGIGIHVKYKIPKLLRMINSSRK